MTLDNLIRTSLNKAAEETKMTEEQKVDLLLDVLTVFLKKQIEDEEEKES